MSNPDSSSKEHRKSDSTRLNDKKKQKVIVQQHKPLSKQKEGRNKSAQINCFPGK